MGLGVGGGVGGGEEDNVEAGVGLGVGPGVVGCVGVSPGTSEFAGGETPGMCCRSGKYEATIDLRCPVRSKQAWRIYKLTH